MYLQENTDAAKAMRKNVTRLLLSENRANRDLALEMIKAGGMPLEVLVDVYHLYFPSWQHSIGIAAERTAFADNLLQQALPDRIFQYIQRYLASLNLAYGPRHWIFRGNDFFDMLIADGLADLHRLAECWQISQTWLDDTDLTQYLLQHAHAIDKNIFIDPRLQKAHLNRPVMRVLLESEDPLFDKKAFVAQYIQGGTLDLSHTALNEIPSVCLEFAEIDTIVISGTNIRQLPEQLLFQLKGIQCNEKRIRHFEREIAAMPFQNFYLATQLTLKKAELDFAGENYAGTIEKLQSIEDRVLLPSFSAESICTFWETYFNAALDSGQTALAKEILKKGFERIPGQFGPPRWKNWADRMLQFVLEGSIEEWQRLAAPFLVEAPSYQRFLNLENHHFWVHAFRTTVSQKRFADARQVLQMAITHAGDGFLHRFPWFLYLKHLHEMGDTTEILETLAQYPKQIWQMYRFWGRWQDRISEINNILISAFLQKGNLAQAEILCTSMITHFHQIPVAEGDMMRSKFYHAQHNAVDAYRFLAVIYAESRPACAQYFQEMAVKHQRPRPRYVPLLEQVLADVNHDYAPDVWANVERPKVFGKLKSLIPQDWKKLEVRWVDLEVFGKRQLADLLRSLKHVHSKKLLAKMLTDQDASVGAAVAIALLELDFRWNPKKSIVAEVQRHHDNNKGYEQEQIARLLGRPVSE
ncbi:MAG: hypothetical protein RLZZ519_2509 [Bacteroidota bacterium]|jgi:hypothetical protein